MSPWQQHPKVMPVSWLLSRDPRRRLLTSAENGVWTELDLGRQLVCLDEQAETNAGVFGTSFIIFTPSQVQFVGDFRYVNYASVINTLSTTQSNSVNINVWYEMIDTMALNRSDINLFTWSFSNLRPTTTSGSCFWQKGQEPDVLSRCFSPSESMFDVCSRLALVGYCRLLLNIPSLFLSGYGISSWKYGRYHYYHCILQWWTNYRWWEQGKRNQDL